MRDEKQAVAELGQHLTDLSGCVQEGLGKYVRDYKSLRHQHSPRSESSLINDLIVNEVRQRFSSKAGVNVLKRGNQILLNVAGKYLLKFKKLHHRRGASFIATRAASRFVAQLSLEPAAQRMTNLFVGYVRDHAELLNSSAWIMCPDGKTITWRFQLQPALVRPIPLRPPAATEQRRRRVTPKKKDSKPDAGEQNGV